MSQNVFPRESANPEALRHVRPGREWIERGRDMPRHRHLDAYALVVLKGAIEQISYAGRAVARAGDMLVQPTLDCHANRMISAGAEVLRLPWPIEQSVGGAVTLSDPDSIVRIAESNWALAGTLARAEATTHGLRRGAADDWADQLATDLASGAASSITSWAEQAGLARETVSRGFAKIYGVSPVRLRIELRTRSAWLRTITSRDRLADIAATNGFADQAHMGRAVRALTGAAPNVWRARVHSSPST